MRIPKVLQVLLALSLLLGMGAWWASRRADPRHLLALALREHTAKLPFQIESIEIEKSWRALLHGHLDSLGAVLRWGKFRIRLKGPLQIETDGKLSDRNTELEAFFSPTFTIEPVDRPEMRSDPIDLDLKLLASRDLKTVKSIELDSKSARWEWKFMGTALTGLETTLRWDPKGATQKLTLRSLDYHALGAEPIRVELEDLVLNDQTAIDPETHRLGKNTELSLRGKSGKVFWKGREVRVPLSSFPVALRADLDPAIPSARFNMKLGSISLKGALEGKSGQIKDATLDWKLPELQIPAVLAEISSIEPELEPLLRKLKLRSGTLSAHGSFKTQEGHPETRAEIRVKDLSSWPTDLPIALGGVDLLVDLESRHRIATVSGELSAKKLDALHLHSELKTTPFSFRSKADLHGKWRNWSVKVGESGIPIKSALPLEIGVLRGEFELGEPKPTFRLTTSAALRPIELARIAPAFCVRNDGKIPLPQASFEATFPKIEAGTESIEPKGKASISIFDGKVEIDELGVYGLGGSVPEFDFSAEMKGVQLGKISEWLSLGEMRGTLEGFAHDVTLQGSLPTRFDTRFEVRPLPGRARVVFSPEAAQSFIEVIAGSSLPDLPGILKWYAFGTPRYIFGGYDIDYAGMVLHASDGFIRVETLDPPSVYKKEGKHFILYGQSIFARVPVLGGLAEGGLRVPIESSHYPVIMDAAAISNYLAELKGRLESLKVRKAKSKEKSPNVQIENDDDEVDCSPPDPLSAEVPG